MNDLVLFCLFILGLPVLLIIIVLCSQDCSTLHHIFRRRQQQHHPHRPEPQPQQSTTTQHLQRVRVEQSVDPHNIERSERLESISYRPYIGYVLKSTIDPYVETNEEKKEQELSPESQKTDDTVTVATDVLCKHSSSTTTSSLNSTYLVVDFGDFEILPLEESSCPICLLEYEHGEIVQRNASNGYLYNYSSRYHQNCTNTNQSVDMHQCDHIFHKNCITKWMQSNIHHECPICRRVFRDGDALLSHALLM
jgi:Anaphase-promoting complex subunit 11 RING-H2 finger